MIHLDYKLAFIVPYRSREEHLKKFTRHYKKLFPEADIYIIHQLGDDYFNRGMLLNIGFLYAENNADAFDLCDIDMLAVEGSVDYSFPETVTHLASAVSQYNYKMPYPGYFSGHVLLTAVQMRAVNGFYNDYPGYGCEDDCFYRSFLERHIPVQRRYGKYESLWHEKVINQDIKLKDLFKRNWEQSSKPRNFENGLSSCSYKIKKVHTFPCYYQVDVEIPKSRIEI